MFHKVNLVLVQDINAYKVEYIIGYIVEYVMEYVVEYAHIGPRRWAARSEIRRATARPP